MIFIRLRTDRLPARTLQTERQAFPGGLYSAVPQIPTVRAAVALAQLRRPRPQSAVSAQRRKPVKWIDVYLDAAGSLDGAIDSAAQLWPTRLR